MKKRKKFFTNIIVSVMLMVIMVGVGVLAVNDESINFKIGIKYDPQIIVAVEINDTLIFDNHDVGSVDYRAEYISSMTSDTINLLKGTVAKQGEEVTLTFYNYNSKTLKVYVCDSETAVSVDPMTSNEVKTATTTLKPAEIGALIISLHFEVATMHKVIFDATDGTYADGSTQKIVYVEDGKTVSVPETPTKTNYYVLYWSTVQNSFVESYEGECNFPLTVTAEQTIYAVWWAKGMVPPKVVPELPLIV